jgi:hypothetical protein
LILIKLKESNSNGSSGGGNGDHSLPFQARSSQGDVIPSGLPLAGGGKANPRYYKRLMYVDIEKDSVKGQIKWYFNEKAPKVRKVSSRRVCLFSSLLFLCRFFPFRTTD